MEIGGRPILWHVMSIYIAQGFTRFLLLTGYKAGSVMDFATGEPWPAEVSVRCLDTGLDTPTGSRVRQAAEAIGPEPFCATYADGVANIDLHALLEEHQRGRRQATMTVVRPELPFGVAELNGDNLVVGFAEKPRSERWINGGFFCFQPEIAGRLGDEDVLEREPLARLAAEGQLGAFRHRGFWECLDTHKDALLLNDLWNAGRAPWKLWA